jgi:hypothetical protein
MTSIPKPQTPDERQVGTSLPEYHSKRKRHFAIRSILVSFNARVNNKVNGA